MELFSQLQSFSREHQDRASLNSEQTGGDQKDHGSQLETAYLILPLRFGLVFVLLSHFKLLHAVLLGQLLLRHTRDVLHCLQGFNMKNRLDIIVKVKSYVPYIHQKVHQQSRGRNQTSRVHTIQLHMDKKNKSF